MVIVQLDTQILFIVFIYLFIVLYLFRACRAHHQEKQIVSIPLLVIVTPCWWQCRVLVGSLPTTSPHTSDSVFCLTTGSEPPLKRFLHIVRSRASSFKREYPLLSLRSSSSFLHLLPRLLVTSISPFIFPSITYFRRQFLRKM